MLSVFFPGGMVFRIEMHVAYVSVLKVYDMNLNVFVISIHMRH